MGIREDLVAAATSAELVDTHEHLLEEHTRLAGSTDPNTQPRSRRDFSILFSHYANDDLRSAGMPEAELDVVLRTDAEPREKWKLISPYYERSRHTGYLANVRESVRSLYGEDDICDENVEKISKSVADGVKPGYYRSVLRDVAGISYCQVNSLETPVFMETELPDLLAQDLSIVALSTGIRGMAAAAKVGMQAGSLADWHRVIDRCFELYGPRAIAIKSQAAYERGLDYSDVSASEASALFERFVTSPVDITDAEFKLLQDHLFNYCLQKAQEFRLPVKLHTGYYAGTSHMPLHRLRNNAGDVAELLLRYPNVNFVIMHIDYPYQDEAIALAKHFPNATVDMCWAWIINPEASSRFLREFLVSAPANKVLCFGGDYMPVELVPGHAALARRGIAGVIADLVEGHYIGEHEAPELLARLMNRNAAELFDFERTRREWQRK